MLIIPDLLEYQLPRKARKVCTSAEIKPPTVRLSPPLNRYLSQHLQNDHQQKKPDHNDKNQTFKHKRNTATSANLKKNNKGHYWHFQNVLGAPAIVLGAPSNTFLFGLLEWPIKRLKKYSEKSARSNNPKILSKSNPRF